MKWASSVSLVLSAWHPETGCKLLAPLPAARSTRLLNFICFVRSDVLGNPVVLIHFIMFNFLSFLICVLFCFVSCLLFSFVCNLFPYLPFVCHSSFFAACFSFIALIYPFLLLVCCVPLILFALHFLLFVYFPVFALHLRFFFLICLLFFCLICPHLPVFGSFLFLRPLIFDLLEFFPLLALYYSLASCFLFAYLPFFGFLQFSSLLLF